MPRIADISLSFLFVAFFGYYGLLGYAFGSLSGENPLPYVWLTIVGITAIVVSIFIKPVPYFMLIRGIGLLLLLPMVIFDLNHSFAPQTSDAERIRFIFTYSPVIFIGVYILISLVRLKTLKGDISS